MTADQIDRTCSNCDKILPTDDKGIQSGWYCCDDYACSETCLTIIAKMGMDEWEQTHYEDGGDCYWTEWEE